MLARSMQNPKQTVCKRVLGMEGDEVRVRQSSKMGPGRTVLVSRGSPEQRRLRPHAARKSLCCVSISTLLTSSASSMEAPSEDVHGVDFMVVVTLPCWRCSGNAHLITSDSLQKHWQSEMYFSTYLYNVQVPQGHVWLQGDNPINSTDSRHYGPVPYALLRGRAFLKVSRHSS